MSALLSVLAGSAKPNATFIFNDTVSADRQAYNIRTEAIAGGWDGVSLLDATITISAGIRIFGGFFTDTGYRDGTTLRLDMSAGGVFIYGRGGDGGEGGAESQSGTSGEQGLNALSADYAITIDNLGSTLAGGGNGGNGGNGGSLADASGGGGGGGAPDGLGGQNGGTGTDGQDGTIAGPGLGGPGDADGSDGSDGDVLGLTGKAVVGDSFINWTNTGTRIGAVT